MAGKSSNTVIKRKYGRERERERVCVCESVRERGERQWQYKVGSNDFSIYN